MTVEVYKNALTIEQVKRLREIRNRYDSRMTYFNESRDEIMSLFEGFFDQIGVKAKKVIGRYFFQSHPYGIHSDGLSANGGKNPINTSILFPLLWTPYESSTSTVFFDQFVVGDSTHGKRFYSRVIPPDKDELLFETDYSTLKNLTDEPFDKEIYNKYLSYIDYDNLHGLTFHKTVEWKRGDAIKFESNRIHCSTDFKTLGLNFKLYIFFKFYIPE